MRADTRGVSVALTHSLTLGITALLVSGLIFAVGGAVDTQRERAVEGELTTIGERLATEITAIDRTANATGANLTVETAHPERVVGTPYRVSLNDSASGCDADACLFLETRDPRVSVVVPVANDVDVTASSAPGGAVAIMHDGEGVALGGVSS
jgi:hypothetical protein